MPRRRNRDSRDQELRPRHLRDDGQLQAILRALKAVMLPPVQEATRFLPPDAELPEPPTSSCIPPAPIDEVQQLTDDLTRHYRPRDSRSIDVVQELAQALLQQRIVMTRAAQYTSFERLWPSARPSRLPRDADQVSRLLRECRRVRDSLGQLYVGLCDQQSGRSRWEVSRETLVALEYLTDEIMLDDGVTDVSDELSTCAVKTAAQELLAVVSPVVGRVRARPDISLVTLTKVEVGRVYWRTDDLFLALDERIWLLERLRVAPVPIPLTVDMSMEVDPRDAFLQTGRSIVEEHRKASAAVEVARRKLDPCNRLRLVVDNDSI